MALFFHRSQLLCYGLWDHEESQLSKEQDRGSGKKGFEEERAPLGPQTEADTGPQGEPAVAGALTQDHIPAEAGDGPAEPPVELKPRDMKRISLRFRKTRRESTEPVEPASAEGVTAASGREKWSRPRERVTAVGLRLQSFCLAMARSVYRPLRRFFHDILHTKYRAATDVYALMFLADVVDFIIIIFGFWAFGVSAEPGGHPAACPQLPPDLCSPRSGILQTMSLASALFKLCQQLRFGSVWHSRFFHEVR